MAMTGFEARQATHSDAGMIEKITKEAFKRYAALAGICPDTLDALGETQEDIRRDIDEKLVFIAFMDGIPAGSVRVQVNSQDSTAYMSRFGVRADMQNGGIGKSLMDLVDARMEEIGVGRLSLHTASKIEYLMCFYHSRGFSIDSTDQSKGYIRAFMHKDYKQGN